MPTKSFASDPGGRKWYLVDAEQYALGRLASHVAVILRGKHKPIIRIERGIDQGVFVEQHWLGGNVANLHVIGRTQAPLAANDFI